MEGQRKESSKACKFKILAINPGSTSTKISVYENEKCLWEKTIEHSPMTLEQFERVWDQYSLRKSIILHELSRSGFSLDGFSAIVGRGGLLSSIPSGTYRVNQKMIDDLRAAARGEHASNLGAVLAYGIAWDLSLPAFIVDPVVVDELDPIARYSGIPEIERESIIHALNINSVARKAAKQIRKPLDSLNLVIAHMGGGISLAAMKRGRMVEVVNGLSEGPFTPERAGALPTLPLLKLAFDGGRTFRQLKERLVGKGGLTAYLGTNSALQVEEMIRDGNGKAKEIYEAMAYQTAREIGSLAVVLKGKVDAIILTGGLAKSRMITSWIIERIGFLGKVMIFPGQNEMESLAMGALRILRGEEPPRIYGVKKRTIGVFYWEPISEYEIAITELEKALKEAGFHFRERNEDLEIIYRNADMSEETLRNIIRDFLDLKVDLIYSIGSPVVSTVKRVLKDRSTPVVCAAIFDPVVMGLVNGYDRSGTNIASSCYRLSITRQLREGLLRLFSQLRKLGFIYRTGELHSEIQRDEIRKAAKELKLGLVDFDMQEDDQLDEAVALFKEKGVEALFLSSDTNFTNMPRDLLAKLTRVFPTQSALKSTVVKGSLLSYSADFHDVGEQGARLAVRILSGESPADLPIAQPRGYDLTLNLQTAELLGITIPCHMIEDAHEVIR
jgi:butyrate kinase